MSRHEEFTKEKVQSPVTNFLKWSNSNGAFNDYDKQTKETSLKKMPLKFLVLANYISIGGFDEASNSGYWSNEIKDTRTETLFVRNGNGLFKQGLYADIKADLAVVKCKYTEALYVMLEDGTLGHIKLSGTNSRLWFSFKAIAKTKLSKNWTVFSDAKVAKKGSITWSEPTISIGEEISAEDAAKADILYDVIQAYKTAPIESEDINESHSTKMMNDALAKLDAIDAETIDTEIDELPF